MNYLDPWGGSVASSVCCVSALSNAVGMGTSLPGLVTSYFYSMLRYAPTSLEGPLMGSMLATLTYLLGYYSGITYIYDSYDGTSSDPCPLQCPEVSGALTWRPVPDV